jgi:hypothetical protein
MQSSYQPNTATPTSTTPNRLRGPPALGRTGHSSNGTLGAPPSSTTTTSLGSSSSTSTSSLALSKRLAAPNGFVNASTTIDNNDLSDNDHENEHQNGQAVASALSSSFKRASVLSSPSPYQPSSSSNRTSGSGSGVIHGQSISTPSTPSTTLKASPRGSDASQVSIPRPYLLTELPSPLAASIGHLVPPLQATTSSSPSISSDGKGEPMPSTMIIANDGIKHKL